MVGGFGDALPVLFHLAVGADPDRRANDAYRLFAVHHHLAPGAVFFCLTLLAFLYFIYGIAVSGRLPYIESGQRRGDHAELP